MNSAEVRMRAYDPVAVDEFFAAAAHQRLRFREAIDAAKARADTARRQLLEGRDIRERIGTLLIEAERRHSQLEIDTARAVEEILAAADAEAEFILASARAEVARQRMAAIVRQVSENPSPASADVIDLSTMRALEVG